ncbi:MAG: hypothetical protein J6C13_00490 [Clostridia bacterium]|nr:hypothetical protein [Clostridia bacterium]
MIKKISLIVYLVSIISVSAVIVIIFSLTPKLFGANPMPIYEVYITLNVNNADYGSVTDSFETYGGETVNIIATPNTGYKFESWTDLEGNIISTEANYTFVVWENITYTANFVEAFNIYADNNLITDFIKTYDKDNFEMHLLITPDENTYITEISFDNITFYKLNSWQGQIWEACPFALSVKYYINEGSNKLGLLFNFAYRESRINIYTHTSNQPYSNLKEPTNMISGIAVTATKGGKVSILGDEYDELSNEDTVICVATPSLKDYEFVGWYKSTDEENCLSNNLSERFLKADIIDSLLIAKFQPINLSINNDLDN